jgi:hypothetical protein
MKYKLIRLIATWFFCGVVLSGLSYSVAVITAVPAYAADCTPHCSAFLMGAQAICDGLHGGLYSFECPLSGNNNYYYYECNDGYAVESFCEN